MRTERTYMGDKHMNNIHMRRHAYGIHKKVDIQIEGTYTKCVQRVYTHRGDTQMEGAYPYERTYTWTTCNRRGYAHGMRTERTYA